MSTEVGKLRVARAMAPSREPRMDCLAAWQPHCDSRNGKDSALPQKLARLGYTNELPGEVPAGRLREVLALSIRLRPGPRKLDQIPLFLVGFGVADRKHRFSGVLPELICLRYGHLSGARHPTAPASLNKAEVGRLSFRPNQLI